MTRGRERYQGGRVVGTEAGGWEIHYNGGPRRRPTLGQK